MEMKVICGGECELWVDDLHIVPPYSEIFQKHAARFQVHSSAPLLAVLIEQENSSKLTFLTSSGITTAPNRTLHSTQYEACT